MSEKEEKDSLRREIEHLKRENEELKQKLEKEQEEKEAIKKECNEVKKEFEEYKARHPETVGVKNGKPYVIVAPNVSPERKPPGARQGHKPAWRRMPVSIDKRVRVPVKTCPECGCTELSDVQETRKRVIEDIPVAQPVVTKYLIERRYCPICKCLVETPVTAAFPKARLGIRVMLMVAWLKIGLRMTEQAIPEVLKASFGLTLSEGEVIRMLDQVARAFGPFYRDLKKLVRKAKARNMDDTSWKIFGENRNLWVFVTKAEALYVIAKSRSHEVPLKVLGRRPNGADMHDRHSAFETLARKTGNRPQQYCWAHVLADAKELAQFIGEEGGLILRVLKKTFDDAKQVEHVGSPEDVERLFHYMKDNFTRHFESTKCRRFAQKLLTEKDRLFLFVTNPDVDATNNAAERALRHSVIARKISGGSKSEKGAKVYQNLISVIQTLKTRGQDLLTAGPSILLASHG